MGGALTRTLTPTPANLSTTNSLVVGAPFSALGWVGALDEVEIYNRGLSTNELYSIYTAGMAGKCKPCCYSNVLTIAQVSPDSVEVNWGGCAPYCSPPACSGPRLRLRTPPRPTSFLRGARRCSTGWTANSIPSADLFSA